MSPLHTQNINHVIHRPYYTNNSTSLPNAKSDVPFFHLQDVTYNSWTLKHMSFEQNM